MGPMLAMGVYIIGLLWSAYIGQLGQYPKNLSVASGMQTFFCPFVAWLPRFQCARKPTGTLTSHQAKKLGPAPLPPAA